MSAPSSRPDSREHADMVRSVLTGRLGTHEATIFALDSLDALLAEVERLEEALEAESCPIPPEDWEPAKAEWHKFHLALTDAQRARAEAAEALAERHAVALRFYADLGPDDIPYADTINDPPDIGRVVREALADGGQETA